MLSLLYSVSRPLRLLSLLLSVNRFLLCCIHFLLLCVLFTLLYCYFFSSPPLSLFFFSTVLPPLRFCLLPLLCSYHNSPFSRRCYHRSSFAVSQVLLCWPLSIDSSADLLIFPFPRHLLPSVVPMFSPPLPPSPPLLLIALSPSHTLLLSSPFLILSPPLSPLYHCLSICFLCICTKVKQLSSKYKQVLPAQWPLGCCSQYCSAGLAPQALSSIPPNTHFDLLQQLLG